MGCQKVCRPLHQGGLGIHNLEMMSWSLNLKWLWLKKTQPDRPWDRWINGNSISKMAPNLVASVAKRVVKIRTVQEALDEGHWITDIRGTWT